MTRKRNLLEKIASGPLRVWTRLREDGFWNTLQWCLYQCEWRLRERALGINTREFAHGVVVGDDGCCNGYEPVDFRCFDIVMQHLSPVRPEDVFLDYGCGMGRAVVLAAQHPFRRVLGVEIDRRLAGIGREQVRRAQQRGCVKADRVDIIEADASRFELPNDVNRIFLYNSFTNELLHSTLERVRDSILEHPREVLLVYSQPIIDHDVLADLPWLEMSEELSTGFWKHIRTRVYRALPATQAMIQPTTRGTSPKYASPQMATAQ